MSDEHPPANPAAPRQEASPAAGLATRLLTRLFFRPAQVLFHRELPGGMHLITLQGDALRDLSWSAGDKLQVKVGPGLQTRTYTPLDWDAANGRTRILAHALALGPGSEWAHRATPGQPVLVFGPRASLPLGELDPDHGVLLGDETAIGLSVAWRPRCTILEVGAPPAIGGLLAEVGVGGATLLDANEEGHLDRMVASALGQRGPETRFVIAGRARSIQHVVRALKREGIASGRIHTRAFWSDGKTGLD